MVLSKSGPGERMDASHRSWAFDIILIFLLVASVIAISAHGPSTTSAHAQLQHIGAVIGAIESGNYLLPHNQLGELARKPQLYTWLAAPAIMLTGSHSDFVFRLPTVLASFAMAAMVYWLGRRWYDRATGLLAACLWVTIQHMSKLMYLAVTDMLLTLWITGSIVCVDRLLFHRAAANARRRWAAGFWVFMILGALTKGWGLVNPVLVGGMIALATAVGSGFAGLRAVSGTGRKCAVAVRLIGRRWLRAAKALRLAWGVLAMAVVLVPLWIAMLIIGGEEFREVVYFEVFQRALGTGENPPRVGSVPAGAYLVYSLLPVSIFAGGALALVRPRRWFSLDGPICLPLCWILAVLVPFSLAHGFRPDYLLPCYAAAALMGAWAIEQVRRRRTQASRAVRCLRHIFAAVPIVIGISLIVMPLLSLLHDRLPSVLTRNIEMPEFIKAETPWICAALIPLGAAIVALAIRASLRWRIRAVAGVAVVGMLGVMFFNTHVTSRHARVPDGETMVAFSRRAEPIVGDEDFAVFQAGKLCVELYLGRFGTPIHEQSKLAEGLNRLDVPWLITCDRGLVEAGAAREDVEGDYQLKIDGVEHRFSTLPEQIGQVVHVSDRGITSQRWGRIYLIEINRPVRLAGEPLFTGHISGRPDDD